MVCDTFPLWNSCCCMFFRLCSAVPNKSRHWVNKIASKCMQYRLVKNKNKEKVTDFAFAFYMELFLLSQILSQDGGTPMHKIHFTRNSCRFALQSSMGPFKCYITLFSWKLDPHPPSASSRIRFLPVQAQPTAARSSRQAVVTPRGRHATRSRTVVTLAGVEISQNYHLSAG